MGNEMHTMQKGYAMYILLEPGIEIKLGDEAYINGRWVPLTPSNIVKWEIDYNFPIRRKINNADDLLSVYNNKEGKT
jgi:hypothetical protein